MTTISTDGRSRIMRGVRSRDTKPELLLRRALGAHGMSGYRVHAAHLPGRPDVCFTRWKVAVFVDGCFWHSCPTCRLTPASNQDYWQPKLERNQRRDALVAQQLEGLGYQVVRIWEHELHADMDQCVARVEAALEHRRRGPEAARHD